MCEKSSFGVAILFYRESVCDFFLGSGLRLLKSLEGVGTFWSQVFFSYEWSKCVEMQFEVVKCLKFDYKNAENSSIF